MSEKKLVETLREVTADIKLAPRPPLNTAQKCWTTAIGSLALDEHSSHWKLRPVVGGLFCALFLSSLQDMRWCSVTGRHSKHYSQTQVSHNNIVCSYLSAYQELHNGNLKPLAVNYDPSHP